MKNLSAKQSEVLRQIRAYLLPINKELECRTYELEKGYDIIVYFKQSEGDYIHSNGFKIIFDFVDSEFLTIEVNANEINGFIQKMRYETMTGFKLILKRHCD